MRNSRGGKRFENVESWDKKSEQQREEKKTGHRREINAMTKGTKGTRKGQTKRKWGEERRYKRATGGGGEKKSEVMSARVRRQTRDLHTGRQVSRALKKCKMRKRDIEGGGEGTEWETEMIKCWLPFVYTCSTRPKHAYAPVNLIKAWYLTSRAGLAQVSARLFPCVMCVCMCVSLLNRIVRPRRVGINTDLCHSARHCFNFFNEVIYAKLSSRSCPVASLNLRS